MSLHDTTKKNGLGFDKISHLYRLEQGELDQSDFLSSHIRKFEHSVPKASGRNADLSRTAISSSSPDEIWSLDSTHNAQERGYFSVKVTLLSTTNNTTQL